MTRDQHNPVNFRRPPILGRRLKLMGLLITTLAVFGLLVQHWWNGWVRHGLGW